MLALPGVYWLQLLPYVVIFFHELLLDYKVSLDGRLFLLHQYFFQLIDATVLQCKFIILNRRKRLFRVRCII
jgi:hypothetical protein